MQAHTIDDVVPQLEAIIDWTHAMQSRLGYFPALYRKMTLAVQAGINTGVFDDNARMAHIGVTFANRYFTAFDQYQNGKRPTQAWLFSFEAAQRWWPTVVQHLLFGMNAHIHLDLGIAVARSVPPESLEQVRDDFTRINNILADLIDQVQTELAATWTFYRVLDRLTHRHDEIIMNFSLAKARDQAWHVAQRLVALSEVEQEREILALDATAVHIARFVLHPGLPANFILKVMRVGERGTIADIIDILR